MDKLKLFCGTGNPALAKEIAATLDVKLGKASVSRFPDSEAHIKVDEDVRGSDVFIVQPTSPPGDKNLMELLIFIDCLRRASAARITAVLPYFGYARQDRKDEGRTPITAKLVANLITQAGADRLLTLDLHAPQIQGFFDIPVDHLTGVPVLSEYFVQQNGLDNVVVVSPDVGSIKIARVFAERLGATLAIVDKRRISADQAEVANVIGDVQGKTAILTDDMISTAGTLTEAAKIAKERGADRVYASAIHAVFCGQVRERLEGSPIDEVVVLDTVPVTLKVQRPRITVLSCAPLLGEAIKRIHFNQSVSSMFKE